MDDDIFILDEAGDALSWFCEADFVFTPDASSEVGGRRRMQRLHRGPKDLKQVWFAGVHCDVGGGYPEKESGLSKIALDWMIQEAKKHGLRINIAREDEVLGKTSGRYAPSDANADLHESLTGAWNIAEFVLKNHYDWSTRNHAFRMNLYRR